MFSQLRTTDQDKKLEILQKIFREYYNFDPVKGLPYVHQTITLAKRLNDKKAETGAYYALASYYQCRGMMDSAFFFCQIALDISKILNSKSLIAHGYSDMGDLFRVRGEKVKAIEYLKKSLELDSTNKSHVAGCCYSLGLLYADAGCPEESAYYYLKSLKIKEEQKKWIDAAYLICNLSGFYFRSSYREQGFLAYEKALSYFRLAKHLKGESYVYNLMGMTYFSDKNYLSALKYFRKSLAINYLDTITIRSGFSFNLTNIGDTWMKLKRFDSAQFYYSRALDFSSRDQDYLPMSCTYLSLGEMNTELKNYTTAIQFLNQGLYYSRLLNYRVQWETAYNLLSECYNAAGNHEKALLYLKLHNEIKDSIFTEKAHQEVANMTIKYETQKKDKEIIRLNVDSKNKQAKIRIAVIIILLIVMITGFVSYYIWLYYRKKVMPKVKALSFIQEMISIEKEGDNRRLRAFDKLLPPELKPFTDTPPLPTEINKNLIVQLEGLLIKDKIYLNENMSLTETAHMLDTNTAYLSRLINEHYTINFSAFLNRYRIEEAKKMILDDHCNNLSIEGIAKNAGFRSKSTFNQVFKNSTGLTPTEFAVRNGKVRA
ncbi:MAG: helix-turn-helix domain-containing protein [Bacteroidetes bacterium]|nr:helix-turn-helix domain-containing protein [Bacteroidota bacterium]